MAATNKSSLAEQAASIRGLLGVGGGAVTPEMYGKLVAELIDSVPLLGISRTYWINPDGGDDEADGLTQETAHRTAIHAAAHQIIAPRTKVTVYLLPTVAAEGIDDEYLFDLLGNGPKGELEIIGVGTTTVAGPFTLSATLDAQERVLEFSGQAWTAKEFSGYDIEVASSSVHASLVGVARTIIYNHADDIVAGNNFWSYDGTWHGPAAIGDTFNVVEPAVKIKTAPRVVAGASSPKSRRMIIGGTGARDQNYTGPATGGVLRLMNLEMRIPDGESVGPTFTGCVEPIGLHITSNFNGEVEVHFDDASIRSAEWSKDLYGRGVCTRSRNASYKRRPRLDVTRSVVGWCGSTGPVFLKGGSTFYWFDGTMFDMEGYPTSYPHAALHASSGSRVVTSSTVEETNYVYSVAGAYDFEAQDGSIDLYERVHHVGLGAIARARDRGVVVFANGKAPSVHDGTLGTKNVGAVVDEPGLRAELGGVIRLIGWDGSVARSATVGQNETETRILVSLPFVTTDINGKVEKELSLIIRTA